MRKGTIMGSIPGDDGWIAQLDALDANLQHESELTASQIERALGRVRSVRGVVWGPIRYGATEDGSTYARIVVVSPDDDADVVIYAFERNVNAVPNPDGDSLGLDGVDDGAIVDVVWSWNSIKNPRYRVLEVLVDVED